jgi:hypothetical protein
MIIVRRHARLSLGAFDAIEDYGGVNGARPMYLPSKTLRIWASDCSPCGSAGETFATQIRFLDP